MGRYITRIPSMSDLTDVATLNGDNGEGLTYNSTTSKWESDSTLEKTTNKDIADGYPGLNSNGELDAGLF